MYIILKIIKKPPQDNASAAAFGLCIQLLPGV